MSYAFQELDLNGIDYIQSTEPTPEDGSVWAEPVNDTYRIRVSDGNNWYGEWQILDVPTDPRGNTIDVSAYDTVEVTGWGAGGGNSDWTKSTGGGDGGYLKCEIDTSNISTFEVYTGTGGKSKVQISYNDPIEEAAGKGYRDGGPPADPNLQTYSGGGGGGSSAILDGNGNELLHIDAGGGGSGDADFIESSSDVEYAENDAGGGGARGGAAGQGIDGATESNDGRQGNGYGYGGSGASAGASNYGGVRDPEPGGDGGSEVVSPLVTTIEQIRGNGNNGGTGGYTSEPRIGEDASWTMVGHRST